MNMDYEKKVVLIGAGNIGSRHLQALGKIPQKLTIDIVEKIKKNFEISKIRLEEIIDENTKIEINYFDSIEKLDSKADLVIIATNSKGRADLFCDLVKMGYKRFLIEKIVAQSKVEYDKMLQYAQNNNVKVWVDTSRVYFNAYQKIKKIFEGVEPINFLVKCGNEGLGCNAIHFVNLFSFFCNDYEVNLNGEKIDNEILFNKRGNNYVEFTGTVTGTNKSGSILSITFLPEDNLPFEVEIFNKNKHLFIEEKKGHIKILKGDLNINFEFKLEFQSTLTTQIVLDIFAKDSCLLPTLKESSKTHYELFRIFNKHLKKTLNQENELCPIT